LNNNLSKNKPRLINIYWVIAGVVAMSLVTVSRVSLTWPRLSPELMNQVSLFAYSSSMGVSYLSWVVIVILVNYLRVRVPMFSDAHTHWWVIHALGSGCVGLSHLALDTLLVWLAFNRGINVFDTYSENLLQWLPFEILAYWACLGLLSIVAWQRAFVEQSESNTHYTSRFAVEESGDTQLIEVTSVDWIESYDNYVLLWQDNKKTILKETMKNLEETLDPSLFCRIHRSAFVNLNKVKSVVRSESGKTAVQLKNNTRVPVSRRRLSIVRQTLRSGASTMH